LTAVVADLGLHVVAAAEHVVDYDEAFVRIVERHRSAQEPARDQVVADARAN
jgi:hypothetical protein